MDRLIRSTRKRFMVLLVAIICFVVLTIGAVLQIVNVTQIGTNASIGEVHQVASNNEELSDYITSQKNFEAHFVTIASAIKDQEQERLSIALGVTAMGVILFGIIIAITATRILMKPVVEAYSSQERFLQDAAHELRNPLAALTIALQQYDTNKKTDKRLIDTFKRQTKRLIMINEDLLFLERNNQEKFTRVDLSDLLLDVSEELSISAYKKKIKLDIQTDPGITKTIAITDYVRVIKNILDNAIKYSPDKSVVIVRQYMSRGAIEIVVKDKGIGIPQDEMSSIGKRFYRAKNVGIIDGTGLGLAIVKKILNTYGGTLVIRSSNGPGVTAIITIPA